MRVEGRELSWTLSPLEVLARWPRDRRVMLLHSGRPHERWSRYTVMAEPGDTLRFDESAVGEGASQWLGEGEPPAPLAHRPLTDLRSVTRAMPGLWLGYLSYDLRLWTEPVLRRTAGAPPQRRWPILSFSHCPGYLLHDAISGRWLACGTWREGGWPRLTESVPPCDKLHIGAPEPAWPRTAHEAAVARVRDYIAAGDVFQVNLAQRFTATIDGPHPAAGRQVYVRLAEASPAWYGACLELPGSPRRTLLSTSPELFLEVEDGGRVVTRPIKGTRPAAVDPDELRRSVKDQAELAMIVDLLRNDLGRVCAYASVRVVEPRTIETHPTVHHGVATITGQLHHSRDVFDLLRATMPGGSITGAPKVRAMQIIDELEGVRRGPYCGAIGWINGDRACLSVAIRTMLHDVDAGRVDLWAGGGIVADSDPAAEYDETLHKAAAMFASLSGT
jgi:para-aminobenzoate synthetase component 1